MLEYYVEYESADNDPGVNNGIWEADRASSKFRCIRGRTDLSGKIGPDGDVVAAIRALPPDQFLHPSRRALARMYCAPNEYFHRIARPVFGSGLSASIVCWDDHELLIRSQIGGQLDWLIEQLRAICQIVHPSLDTFPTYGHAIRNLLILACTEVEAAWKGVLKSNGYSPVDKKGDARDLNTNDYAKLLPALKLPDYSVRFSAYPWLDVLTPFQGWQADKPSQSLAWYSAYNATKHDREQKFSEATLERAFEAVSACAIMLFAQFGNLAGSRADQFLTIIGKPTWTWPEYYVPGNQVGLEVKLVPVNYRF